MQIIDTCILKSIQLHWLQFLRHLLLSLITGSEDQVIASANMVDAFLLNCNAYTEYRLILSNIGI